MSLRIHGCASLNNLSDGIDHKKSMASYYIISDSPRNSTKLTGG